MISVVHRGTPAGVSAGSDAGITDLLVVETAAGPALYAVSRTGGGITAFALSQGGLATCIGAEVLMLPARSGFAPALATLRLGGTSYLTVDTGLGAAAYPIGAQGRLGEAAAAVSGMIGSLGRLLAAGEVPGGLLALTAPSPSGMALHRLEGGTATLASTLTDTAETYGRAISGAALMEVGGSRVLVAASATEHGVSSYLVGPTGLVQHRDSLGAAQGLGINTPTTLATAEQGGATYVILGAAGTSSLTVLRVGADGALTPTDHIIDDLGTRFSGIRALETVTVAGRVLVVAGGADDGITLLELLPGGRLVHLVTLADTAQTSLANVEAIAAHVVGTDLQVFVASASEAGITQFSVDLSNFAAPMAGTAGADTLAGTARDDLLIGGAGNDLLMGGQGNDIIVDGAGADTMIGGAGRDLFVLTADGETDTIQDFRLSEDRLDLSAFAMAYSLGAFQFQSTATGAILTFGGERTVINTHDGRSLLPGQIPLRDLVGLTRPHGALVDLGRVFRGSAANDSLTGGAGDDVIFGEAGNDTIRGGGGNDRLIGGAGIDSLFGERGSDTLEGGDGTDRLDGGPGGDLLLGGAWHDVLFGGGGRDTLSGGTGNDTLHGGAGGYGGPTLATQRFGHNDGWTTQDRNTRLLGDIDGDGRADILAFGSAQVSVARGMADGTFGAATWAFGDFTAAKGWTSQDRLPRLVGDIDGDGRDDIVGLGLQTAFSSLAGADGAFRPIAVAINNFSNAQGWTSYDRFPRLLADVNGDGRADLVGFGISGTFVALSNGNGTFAPARLVLANFSQSTGWTSFDKLPRVMGDFNGDGRADIMGFGLQKAFVAFAQADGTFGGFRVAIENLSHAQGWSSYNVFTRLAGDIDGDGRDDIIAFGATSIFVVLSRGDGTFDPMRRVADDLTRAQGWTSYDAVPRMLADVNGDGRADIVAFGPNGTLVSLTENDSDIFVFATGFGHDVIMDFDARDPNEKIDLSGHHAAGSYEQVMSLATQVGRNVQIVLDADSLMLIDVSLADLGPEDFLF